MQSPVVAVALEEAVDAVAPRDFRPYREVEGLLAPELQHRVAIDAVVVERRVGVLPRLLAVEPPAPLSGAVHPRCLVRAQPDERHILAAPVGAWAGTRVALARGACVGVRAEYAVQECAAARRAIVCEPPRLEERVECGRTRSARIRSTTPSPRRPSRAGHSRWGCSRSAAARLPAGGSASASSPPRSTSHVANSELRHASPAASMREKSRATKAYVSAVSAPVLVNSTASPRAVRQHHVLAEPVASPTNSPIATSPTTTSTASGSVRSYAFRRSAS